MFDINIRTNQAYLPYTPPPPPPPKQHTTRCTHSRGYPCNSCVTCTDTSINKCLPTSWQQLGTQIWPGSPYTNSNWHTATLRYTLQHTPGKHEVCQDLCLTAVEQYYHWYSCWSDQSDTFSQRLVLLFQFLSSFIYSYKALHISTVISAIDLLVLVIRCHLGVLVNQYSCRFCFANQVFDCKSCLNISCLVSWFYYLLDGPNKTFIRFCFDLKVRQSIIFSSVFSLKLKSCCCRGSVLFHVEQSDQFTILLNSVTVGKQERELWPLSNNYPSQSTNTRQAAPLWWG